MTPPPTSPAPQHPPLGRWQSLRWAVIGALLIGFAMPVTISVALRQQEAATQAEAELQTDLKHNSELLAIALAGPLWEIDAEAAEPLVKALIDDPRFVSAIVNGNGMTRPFLELRQLSGAIGHTATHTRPILRDGAPIGAVTLVMTRQPYQNKINAEARQEITRLLLTLTVAMALVLWVLQQRILRPMSRLSAAAETLASGKLGDPLSISGKDEISRVGLAMENMRARLVGAFSSLQQHASTLEEKVERRTHELRSTNTELNRTLDHLKAAQNSLIESEKLASLGRLVAGVAHELNTPLGNALTVVSTLEERYGSLAEKLNGNQALRKSELSELVTASQLGHDLLRRNVEKAAELIRDFKQVAVDQSSEMRRLFDLGQVIEEVLVTVRPSFKHSPFRIETELPEGLAMDSYPGPLGQVLTNLVLNALIHAFDGAEQGVVRVACRLQGDGWATITCADDGRGMDDATRKRIFDPFFTTRLGRGGSGLGLNIVHNIVTGLLGGTITVTSTPGAGTRFEIALPTRVPDKAAPV